jgi:hypothetical protein
MVRALMTGLLWIFFSQPVGAEPPTQGGEPRIPVIAGENVVLTSSGTHLAARETSGPDTFALYGGPDHPTEGKFQLANGLTPDWGGGNGLPGRYGGGPEAWTPADLTDDPVFWHRSQFNAQALGIVQPSPNHAMWSGVEVGDPVGETWERLPGYGNSWKDALLYESEPLADPSVAQIVNLDFYFHHDVEPGYDYFNVQYDSAGTWTSVLRIDGTDADSLGFGAPGVQFSAVQMVPIVFTGGDYGGDAGDQIRIRLIVTSDGAWSDEDGLWPTVAGAAQVDEITLSHSLGSFTEGFEAEGPYLFEPDKATFVGDYAGVYTRLTDIDPCRENRTPVAGFMDTGQIVRNGPGIGGEISTGGSTSPGVSYGIPGNYVLNYTGGLSFGEVNLTNEIWSPEILWDLPGPEDDDVAIAGAFIRWTGWVHLPLQNGFFYLWHVRSALEGEPFDIWTDRNFVYYGGGVPVWANYRQDVSDILKQRPERVQMALAAWDYASIFSFPGTAATPSPAFDNAAFYKYRLQGPTLTTRNIDIAQDGFPVSGSIDVSTRAARDALDVPFSMARDINSGRLVNSPGDSIIIDFGSVIPGARASDIRMFWALDTNPLFEDEIRAAPSGFRDLNVVAGPTGTVWTGEALPDTVVYDFGMTLFFNLPDEDFMYPGDVLHYYIQATDTDGRVSSWPHDTTGFLDFSPRTPYDRLRTVRALPSIRDEFGDQPRLLIVNDFGHRGGEAEWLWAMHTAGFQEGIDFDTYTVRGPSSIVGNGIGSSGAHGAAPDQLAGYTGIIYLTGDLSVGLLSNGTDSRYNDKGDDVGVLEQWRALPGTRNIAFFGDNIASGMASDSPEALSFLMNSMGVALGDEDVRDVISGQTAPLVVPYGEGPFAPNFDTDYIAYGGCLSINQFDQIQPGASAVAGHLFTDVNGVPFPPNPDPALAGVASVIHPRPNGVSLTFPYAFHHIYNLQVRITNTGARNKLMQEVVHALFNLPTGAVPVTDAPPDRSVILSVRPNPFNPTTMVTFTAAPGSRGSVKVFNLRGELVRTLHTGEFQAQEFRWEGRDSNGAPVSSGVYLIRATDGTVTHTDKVALVK